MRAARVTADSSAGDVALSLRAVPRQVDADSSAGDVEIVLPDAVYRLDAELVGRRRRHPPGATPTRRRRA